MMSSRSSVQTDRLVALSILAPGGLTGPHPMEVNQRGSGFAARQPASHVTANRPDAPSWISLAVPVGWWVPSGVQNGPQPLVVPWLPSGMEPSAGRVLANAVEQGRPQQ